jgi:hypothetical protein
LVDSRGQRSEDPNNHEREQPRSNATKGKGACACHDRIEESPERLAFEKRHAWLLHGKAVAICGPWARVLAAALIEDRRSDIAGGQESAKARLSDAISYLDR